MKTVMLCLVASASLFTIVSCSKDPVKNLTEDESRIYITNHDSTFSFASSNTFTIGDSVAVISNEKFQGKDLTPFDMQFIAAVKAAMIADGYTYVPNGSQADLAIAVSVHSNEQSGIISYDDYGGYYGDYWGGYYPGYSYYYPSYYGVYSYSETALSVDMFDLKDAAGTNQLKNVWSGLIRGSGIFNTDKINAQVQTLFDQSQYLKTN